MKNEEFERIADDVFSRLIEQYNKESEANKALVITEADFLKYVDLRMEALRAHNERFTTELVRRLFNAYSPEA